MNKYRYIHTIYIYIYTYIHTHLYTVQIEDLIHDLPSSRPWRWTLWLFQGGRWPVCVAHQIGFEKVPRWCPVDGSYAETHRGES
jgi:hypothetical protein